MQTRWRFQGVWSELLIKLRKIIGRSSIREGPEFETQHNLPKQWLSSKNADWILSSQRTINFLYKVSFFIKNCRRMVPFDLTLCTINSRFVNSKLVVWSGEQDPSLIFIMQQINEIGFQIKENLSFVVGSGEQDASVIFITDPGTNFKTENLSHILFFNQFLFYLLQWI